MTTIVAGRVLATGSLLRSHATQSLATGTLWVANLVNVYEEDTQDAARTRQQISILASIAGFV